jgi:hypothetical protein
MNKSVSATAACLAAVATLAAGVPVSAQPLRITVTNPRVIETPSPLAPSGRLVRPSTLFDYHLDFRANFDPGKAAQDSQFFSRPSPSFNAVRAVVLDSNNESLAQHQLRCQSLHPTYEPAGDTYLGPDGIPRSCIY